jgi:hypothetical protein
LVCTSWHLSTSQRRIRVLQIPPSVCVCMCIPLSLLGRGTVRTLPRHEYTRSNRRISGRVVFDAVRVISKESSRLVLPRTSCSNYHHLSCFLFVGVAELTYKEQDLASEVTFWYFAARVPVEKTASYL